MKISEKLKGIEQKVQSNKELYEKIKNIVNWYDLKRYFKSKSNNKYTMLIMRIEEGNSADMNLTIFNKRNEFIDEHLISGMDCYFDIMKGDKFNYDTHINLVHLWYNLLDSINCGEELINDYKLLSKIYDE
jgi:hypothetical protein